MIYLYTSPLWLPLLMLVLYAIGIQYQRTTLPQWLRGLCELVAVIAAILDFALNWSLFAFFFWDWPQRDRGEWMLSERMPRLNLDMGWRGQISRSLTIVLNRLAPSGKHISA